MFVLSDGCLAIEQKLKLYEVWQAEGHEFNQNLYLEFLSYCMEEARVDPRCVNRAFAIVEDMKTKGNFTPDVHVCAQSLCFSILTVDYLFFVLGVSAFNSNMRPS